MTIYLSKPTTDNYLRLAEAIVYKAAEDYRRVLLHGDKGTVNRCELEAFFRSPLCALICGHIDPNYIMRGIREGKFRKRNNRAKRSDRYG